MAKLMILVLAITICVTIVIARNINSDDILDLKCNYSYGRPILLPSIRYYDKQLTLLKGSKILNVTLPELEPETAVVFICIKLTNVDTDDGDVILSVINDREINVVVTLNKEAKGNVSADVLTMVASVPEVIQVLKEESDDS